MKRSTSYASFAAICLIWGLTWIGIKTGVASVPPLFFAGTRFAAAGAALLIWQRLAGQGPAELRLAVRRADWGAMLIASLLIIVGTYSLLFWGTKYVASGLAAVLNSALTPVSLFAIGLAYGEERFSLPRLLAILLGAVGIVVLFRPSGPGGREVLELSGMAAIVGGTIAYSWGSVLSRPLLRTYAPELVSGITCLIGGLILIGIALAVEPIGRDTLSAFASPAIAASWLFLVLFGSLLAFTTYLRLVRDWGASRAGMYAFVSPAIAVLVGVLLFGEVVRASDFAGMAIMFSATWLAIRRSETPKIVPSESA